MTAVDLPAVPRVLIAEADPWSRDLLKQVLLNVRCDARLDVCADGQRATELLRDKPYDLIIADWELPGVDGLSLLRSVRLQRRTPLLPFILLSTRNDSASVREALPLAPTAYLPKPLNMESLTQRLQALDDLADRVGHLARRKHDRDRLSLALAEQLRRELRVVEGADQLGRTMAIRAPCSGHVPLAAAPRNRGG
jgi:DNA-binding response OmpR family regulator